ncbi:MAG: hypothetical protein FVQ82_05865 [Planctomycetes bacterium]|nr:hypothetical protein [Planctomycetota bacterium]
MSFLQKQTINQITMVWVLVGVFFLIFYDIFIFAGSRQQIQYVVVYRGIYRDVVAVSLFLCSIALLRYSKNIIFSKKMVLVVDLVGESGIISHIKCTKW